MRVRMFSGMQDLPVRFFDTHNHGDVMSYYTNDIDTLRQMISQSFPQLLISAVTVLTIFSIMLYYSVWLTLVVVAGVVFMLFVTKKVGGNSARYFIRQQVSMGEVEGFVEEMMNGQKVVKVFATRKTASRLSTGSTTSCSTMRSRRTPMPIPWAPFSITSATCCMCWWRWPAASCC